MNHTFRWALIDIKTTGSHVVHDKMIAIAITVITQHGIERTWSALINPGRTIPPGIISLTGITNEAVRNASSFAEHAEALFNLMHDCVLVGHNARFDFGFLKNAFKDAGLNYRTPMLCTIKLIKRLYPGLPSYDLTSLVDYFQLTPLDSYREQSKPEAIHQLIQHCFARHTPVKVLKMAQTMHQQSSIPSKLMTDIHAFPESAGVYLFYSDSSLVPLYIGKSVSLRQRILSHFQGDYAHAKEFNMAQQVTRVEIIPTAGELSALMLESELIKEKMPIYNRRLRRKTQVVGFKLAEQAGYLEIVLVREQVDTKHHLNPHPLIGAFSSIVKAKSALSALVKHFHLCPRLCHLEPGPGACFSYQLKRCQGACVGMESSELYNQRVVEALKEHQEATWPYRRAVAIKEHCPINKITQFLVFHQWRYLGAVQSEEQLDSFGELPLMNRVDYYDTYKILVSYLKKHASCDDLIELA